MKFNPIPLITAMSLLVANMLQAQPDPKYDLLLKSGKISPAANISTITAEKIHRQASRTGGHSFVIIQFENIPAKERIAQLRTAGIELLEYIPNNAYTATVKGVLDVNLLSIIKARAIIDPLPEYKMQPDLAAGKFPAWANRIPGTVNVWASFPKTFTYEQVAQELRVRNFDIISNAYSEYRIIALQVSTERLRDLALLPYIEYVEAAPHEDQALNYNSMFASRANVLKAPALVGGKNLTGQGVVVGVGDEGDIESHIDFTGRVINRESTDISTHASHVAGTIGGAGLIKELYAGYAPKAKLLSSHYSDVIANAGVYVQDHGMVVTNNSYGSVVNDCNFNGLYDLSSRILDQQAIDYPELQHVFAAGNDGTRICTPYPVGFKTVLGGFQSAKNVLTVGATDYKSNLHTSSSKGPVRDGRTKPEIMAMGRFVASTWVDNNYSYSSGTSMAAPAVSGGLALLIEKYRLMHGGANPKSALMKALIVNGSDDRGNAGVDFSYGFGRMNLIRSYTMLENATYFTNALTQGSFVNNVITVPPNTAQLKVLLYWTDPPAAVMAAKTLVNDLDLEVITPTSTAIYPGKLDTLPGNITNTATTGVDRINNIEQVIINDPAAGNYTLKTIATTIAQNPNQEFFLVYDIIPESLRLTSPIGDERLWNTISTLDTGYIEWDSYGGPANTFTLEFSSDDGANYNVLSATIPATDRVYSWIIPDIATEKARIRLTKNGTALTQTSGPFIITNMPVDSLTPTQCPGYIQLGWRPVIGATDYEAMMLRGDEMVSMGTTTNLNFTFSGLSKDSTYLVTVRPRINGKPGRRAWGVLRKPNDGTCSGTISDNDLKVDSIISPVKSGRLFTSTELTNSVPVTIRIKNLDDAVSTADITVSYSMNGGAPVTALLTGPSATIAALGYIDYTFSTMANLSAVGAYNFEVNATKAGDIVTANNKLFKTVKQLDNQPVTIAQLPWLDNLEALPAQEHTTPQMGLTGNDRYDFTYNNFNGRIRSFINTGMAYSGNRALNLDVSHHAAGGNTDSLTATFNLATFNTLTDDIRIDFRYKNHGQPFFPSNAVWIRGNESDNWIKMYDLYANQLPVTAGYKLSASLQVSDSLFAHGQSFTSGFQMRWGQWGSNMTADAEGNDGYSFDDIRIYRVSNDVQVVSIDLPTAVECGLTNTETITVSVRNTANNPINNVPVMLRVNGNIIASQIIGSIPASTTISHDFSPVTANLSAVGSHTIEAWTDLIADTYHENDTAKHVINNLPLITSFPYLQDFESGNGYWYTGGSRSTWAYGTPISPRINRAASGTKIWKTNLAGYYNDGELSYLYSPCFNVAGMTNPTLSFSLALDIEDCGTGLCDAAWVEYSGDEGVTWTKLGAMGEGTNWYNKNYAGNHVWSQQNYTRWHVATAALPTSNNSKLRLRFVFNSDAGLPKDGIAVDDIHIYDNIYGIYDGPTMTTAATQNITGGTTWIDFMETGKLVASVQPNSQSMGNTGVQAYIHPGAVRNYVGQYYHNRNITIKPATTALTDSAIVRFYFLDSEVEALLAATGCGSCSKPSTAYDLGVSKYSDVDDLKEDGDVANSTSGAWSFIQSAKARKVPFDKGYYAEFKVKDFSEFWLNNGGFNNNTSLPVELISFNATKAANNKDVKVTWTTASEWDVNRFEVELARSNAEFAQNIFVTIGEVKSDGNTSLERQYVYNDLENGKVGVRYYRLKIIDNDGRISYSAVRPVVFSDEVVWQVFPNPSDGAYSLICQANEGEKLSVRVYDAGGKMIYQSSTVASGFMQRVNIDLRSGVFGKGLYLIRAGTNTLSQSFKVLKR